MMKINFKSLLKDKNVLYVVLFLAVSNLFGYLLMREIDAVVFFLVVGFLATYFSKNMIVVMLIAMISTNLLIGSKHLRSVKEGNTTMGLAKTADVDGEKVVEIDVDVKNGKEEVKESMVKLTPASVNGKKPKLDYAGTVETAYDNLDDLLSSDAIKNMTADTQRLAEKQKQLINNIGKLEPVMKKAGKLLDGIDMGGINSIVSTLSGTLGKLTGDGKQE
jgi:hypothetical protein